MILVDENDHVLGEIAKMKAHQESLLHRAVSVFVFNTDGKMLLQKRAETKYHSPALWTNAACTHPQPGEENSAAAIRRLEEGMGISVREAEKIFDFKYKATLDQGLTEYEYDHVFMIVTDALPNLNPEEVMDYRYIDVNTLKTDVQKNSHKYTAWFKIIIDRAIEVCSARFPSDNHIQ